jgi:hypothetical protein
MLERLYWPEFRVQKALRGRHAAFSFHTYDELEQMEQESGTPSKLIYRNQAVDRQTFFDRPSAPVQGE